MSIFSVASFSSSFPAVYPRVIPQIQRKCPTLRLFADVQALRPCLTGDKMRWIARFSGQTAQSVNADGGNLPTAAADDRKEIAQSFGTYGAPMQVTDSMRRLPQNNAAVAPGFNPYDQVVGQNAMEAMEVLLKKINQDIYQGDGTSNTMIGFSTIYAASGTYGGIATASYSNWAGTVQANGGVLRSLTLQLLKTMTRTIANASASGRPHFAFCQSAVMDSLENLFTPFTLIQTSMTPGGVQPGVERAAMNPATINLPGGQIKADGFRVLYWQSQNLYFIEDPDAVDAGATNPNNTIFFVNALDTSLEYPPVAAQQQGVYNVPVQAVTAVEQGMGPLGQLPLELTARGRTKLAFEWDLLAYVGIKSLTRNSGGKLQDVQ